jgi:hypothetical protein
MTHKPDIEHIDALAAIIREVDGAHSLGAAALAEAILSHPASQWRPVLPVPNKAELEADLRAWLKANRDSKSCDVITWTERLLQQRPQPASAWPRISDGLIRSLIWDIQCILTHATHAALCGGRFAPIPETRARLLEILELAAGQAAGSDGSQHDLKQDAL